MQYNQNDGIVDVDCLGLKKVRCWEENGYSYIEAKLLVRYITICGAHIDILNGACIACGNSMDVEYYDWILYDIRNV